jgi:hypothetical protein
MRGGETKITPGSHDIRLISNPIPESAYTQTSNCMSGVTHFISLLPDLHNSVLVTEE